MNEHAGDFTARKKRAYHRRLTYTLVREPRRPEGGRPRRPPKFNSRLQRMCDEPSCVYAADWEKNGDHLCAQHFRLRYGRLGKLVEERDRRAAE